MPDFGLRKALQEAVLVGSKGARVARAAEKVRAAQEANLAAEKASLKAAEDVAENPVEPKAPAAQSGKETLAPEKGGEPQAPELRPGEEVGAAAERPLEAAAAKSAAPPAEPRDVLAETLIRPLGEPAEVTAERVSRASLGDFALEESHMPNFERMTTTDDVKATVAALAEQNKTRINEARRGVITNDQLAGLAEDLDLSQDVVRKVLEREAGGILNAETILAARQVVNGSADRIKTMADKIALGKATDLDRVQFVRQLQLHNEFFAQFMGARAETGRALNAFGIPVGIDERVATQINDILVNAGTDVDRIAKAIHMTDTVSGITKQAIGSLSSRAAGATGNLINRIFVNGILSGPRTHLVNTVGNAFFQAMNSFELATAARLGRFLGPREHVQVGEALATLHGSVSATRDAWRLAAKALKSGQTLDSVMKYSVGGEPSTLSRLPELDKPVLRHIIQGIDAGIGLPTRVLAAEDEFFKTLAYRGYIERQALRHVQDQLAAGTLKIEDAARAVREFMENAPEETQQAAEEWIREVTFQTPLGPIGQDIQRALRKIPGGTLIAPFVQTPVNIFKQAAYRSPLALASPKFWADVAKGGVSRDLALTRFAVGSATALLVASYAAEGLITGAGPQDPQARKLLEATGWQPYSIKVWHPGTSTWVYHSYARVEPIASVIGATADTVETMAYLNRDTEELSDDEKEAYKAAGAVVVAIMNNSGNKTFMQGIADFVEFVEDPQRNLRAYSAKMGSALVPYSALTRQIREWNDPYMREAWSLLDKVKDNTPGMSKDLPMQTDFFGEPRLKKSSSLLGVMSPIPEKEEEWDFVTREAANLMKATNKVPLTEPEKDVEGMRLTPQEFADYKRIARTEVQINGKAFKEFLEDAISSSEYERLTPTMKVEYIKKIQSNFDKVARAPNGELETQNPDYADRITSWRMKKEQLRFSE